MKLLTKIKEWWNQPEPIRLRHTQGENRGTVAIMYEINMINEHFEALGCSTTRYSVNLSQIEKDKIERGLKLLQGLEK